MKFCLTAITILFCSLSFAQYQQFPKLEQMRAKQAWTKILKKATKLSANDKYKKEPVPYYFQAEALLHIAKDKSLEKKYPKAFKEAVKLSSKAAKLDEQGTGSIKFANFLITFEQEATIKANQLFNDQKYNRALPIYTAIFDLNNDNLSAQSSRGLCEIEMELSVGYETLASIIRKLEDTTIAQKIQLDSSIAHCFLQMTDHLLEEAVIDSAHKNIKLATALFPEDEAIADQYHLIVKNYKQFYHHYSKYSDALKICVQAANQYKDDKRFLTLEQEAMIKFTDAQILYGKYDFIESIWTNYTTRKRDPNHLENLDVSNDLLVNLIIEYHHIHQPAIAKRLVQVLFNINKNVYEKVKPRDDFSFKLWGKQICTRLMEKNDFYLAHLLSKYIKLYISDDPEINALENEVRAKLNDYKLTLSGQADLFIKDKNTTAGQYVELLTGFHKVKTYEKAYIIFNIIADQYPEDEQLKAIQKKIIIEDYHINFKGSRLIKQFVDDKIVDELRWKGNVKQCKPGHIFETAHIKTLQRINYYRRFAGVDLPSTFSEDLNTKAQQIAFDVYPGTEECKKSNLVKNTPGIQMNGAHTSKAILSMMTATTDAGSRTYILNPKNQIMGHGSTDKNIVIVNDDMNQVDEKYDSLAIAWPPQGMVPAELIYGRWSFSLKNADFSKAKVKMKVFGREVPKENIVIDEFNPQGAGIPTLSWLPKDVILYAQMDLEYEVEVSGVKLPGVEKLQGYKYKVIVIQTK